MRLLRFLLSTLVAALVGGLLGYASPSAPGTQPAPRITSFRTSHTSIRSGESVSLTWQLAGGQPQTVRLSSASGTLTPQGNAVTLTPDVSQTYTLVVENRQGSDQKNLTIEVLGRTAQVTSQSALSGGPASEVAVSGGGSSGGAAAPTLPDGTFGLSLEPDGPFLSDEAGGMENSQDRRIVRVAPGGVFFAEVAYQDPEGIARIDVMLVNRNPRDLSGNLSPTRRPFTLVGAPTGNCKLAERATAVRCRYRIRVGPNARNISALPGAGDEFAYVFRVRVQDGAGDTVNKMVRGYVIVTSRQQ